MTKPERRGEAVGRRRGRDPDHGRRRQPEVRRLEALALDGAAVGPATSVLMTPSGSARPRRRSAGTLSGRRGENKRLRCAVVPARGAVKRRAAGRPIPGGWLGDRSAMSSVGVCRPGEVRDPPHDAARCSRPRRCSRFILGSSVADLAPRCVRAVRVGGGSRDLRRKLVVPRHGAARGEVVERYWFGPFSTGSRRDSRGIPLPSSASRVRVTAICVRSISCSCSARRRPCVVGASARRLYYASQLPMLGHRGDRVPFPRRPRDSACSG